MSRADEEEILKPKNEIIPLKLTKVIVESYDTDMNIMDKETQIYGTAIHGKGTVKFKNGNIFVGQLEFGMLHGQGKFTWTNGVVYEGTFTQNKITGEGRYDWPDESWYVGQVKDGLRHGQGEYESPMDGIKYKGNWTLGMRAGKGRLQYKSGSVYEGEFQKGYKDGFGTMTYVSGNRYEGNWKSNKKHGFGTMFWTIGTNEKYFGQWKNNKQNGFGVHIWIEKRGENKYFRNRYEGYWLDSKRHGLGVFYYANGAKYEGQWFNNLKQGFAFFSYENGKVFQGLFKNDRMVKEDEVQIFKKDSDMSMSKTGKSKKKGEDAQKKRKKNVEIQPNPYADFLDISDLLQNKPNSEFILMKIQNLLLRQNTNLRQWYKAYSPKPEDDQPEESFSMTVEHFWRFIREARMMNSNLTIAAFNRLFEKGAKNSFDLHCDFKRLAVRLKNLMREYKEEKESQNRFPELENVDEAADEEGSPGKKEVKEETKKPSEDENLYKLILPPELEEKSSAVRNVHDPSKVILFRHFTDALVRVGYLKFDRNMEDLASKLDTLFQDITKKMFDVKNTQSTSKTKIKYSQFLNLKEDLFVKMQDVFTQFDDQLKELFCRKLVKPQTMKYELHDLTICCRTVIKMFRNAGLVNDPDKLLQLYIHLEIHNDPEEDYSHVARQVKKIDKELKKLENKSGKRSTEMKAKYNEEKSVKQKLMTERLRELYNTEITYREFKEILGIYFLKKEAESTKQKTKKDDKLKGLLKSKLKKFLDFNNYKQKKVRLRDRRTWKRREKDFLKDRLEERLEEEKLRRLEVKRKEAEMDQENKERGYMKDNDYNITSDIEMANNQDEDESSEESDY